METNRQIVKKIYKFVHKITLSILIIGAILTVFIASNYHGYDAIIIVLIGCIVSTVTAMVSAYFIGNKMSELLRNKVN